MTEQKEQKPIERKAYKLPIDIEQGGEPKKAGETVRLTPSQISRIEQIVAERKAAEAVKQEG